MEFLVTVEANIFKIHARHEEELSLHLAIKRDELIGMQCYIDGNTHMFVVEYSTKHGTIKTEYVDRLQWESIIKQLDNIEFI